MLRDQGAEPHGLGWTARKMWGLHAASPTTRPNGRGLVWLLAGKTVLDVGAEAVGIRHGARGARLACYRARAGAEAAPAWELLP